MNEAVEYEEVITGLVVYSENHHKAIFVGNELNGQEVCSLEIKKNTEKLFIAKAYDEDGYVIYTLNFMEPSVVEVFEKTIAVDGPTEE